ncbi:T-complex protein 11-like protein [Zancudomyces culisetae]|uniref:T-complex protein 11-like protein n=1 Tax=Zancudomyces culisetae TaxID=1213189 RepID=A0A1R1PCL9_ZANCU|nr:T-complex protein 11-like protein [Zancudomyces culisetae]|eukprot:OMH78717.1 T-complex protein 11-like protein [Zancudomyces culisetae]
MENRGKEMKSSKNEGSTEKLEVSKKNFIKTILEWKAQEYTVEKLRELGFENVSRTMMRQDLLELTGNMIYFGKQVLLEECLVVGEQENKQAKTGVDVGIGTGTGTSTSTSTGANLKAIKKQYAKTFLMGYLVAALPEQILTLTRPTHTTTVTTTSEMEEDSALNKGAVENKEMVERRVLSSANSLVAAVEELKNALVSGLDGTSSDNCSSEDSEISTDQIKKFIESHTTFGELFNMWKQYDATSMRQSIKRQYEELGNLFASIRKKSAVEKEVMAWQEMLVVQQEQLLEKAKQISGQGSNFVLDLEERSIQHQLSVNKNEQEYQEEREKGEEYINENEEKKEKENIEPDLDEMQQLQNEYSKIKILYNIMTDNNGGILEENVDQSTKKPSSGVNQEGVDGNIVKVIRDIAERAYFDQLKNEIKEELLKARKNTHANDGGESGGQTELVGDMSKGGGDGVGNRATIQLVKDMKKLLIDIVGEKEEVNERMNLDELQRQLKHGSISVLEIIGYVLEQMAKSCAPIRDKEIAELREKVLKNHVQSGNDSFSRLGADVKNKEEYERRVSIEVDALVSLVQEILRVLQEMRIDLANYHIDKVLKPMLQNLDGVSGSRAGNPNLQQVANRHSIAIELHRKYLAKKFKIDFNCLGGSNTEMLKEKFSNTSEWINKSNKNRQETDMDSSGKAKSREGDTTNYIHEIYNSGIVDLLFNFEHSLGDKGVGYGLGYPRTKSDCFVETVRQIETFEFDIENVVRLYNYKRAIVQTQVVMYLLVYPGNGQRQPQDQQQQRLAGQIFDVFVNNKGVEFLPFDVRGSDHTSNHDYQIDQKVLMEIDYPEQRVHLSTSYDTNENTCSSNSESKPTSSEKQDQSGTLRLYQVLESRLKQYTTEVLKSTLRNADGANSNAGADWDSDMTTKTEQQTFKHLATQLKEFKKMLNRTAYNFNIYCPIYQVLV